MSLRLWKRTMTQHHFFICKNAACKALIEPEPDPENSAHPFKPGSCPNCGRPYDSGEAAEDVGAAYLQILQKPPGHYDLLWLQVKLGLPMALLVAFLFYLAGFF